jgi:hypothetical protein
VLWAYQRMLLYLHDLLSIGPIVIIGTVGVAGTSLALGAANNNGNDAAGSDADDWDANNDDEDHGNDAVRRDS